MAARWQDCLEKESLHLKAYMPEVDVYSGFL